MKEIIFQLLKEETLTTSIYTGGGEEPNIIYFTDSEGINYSEIDSFLRTMAQRIENAIIKTE